MLRLWNTLHRALEEFQPIRPHKVGFYACGPTVYNPLTLGNWRKYLVDDTIRRVFQYLGYEITHVTNITDVGHLVGDASEGEDKVEREAAKTGKTAWDIARFYEASFLDGLKQFNILLPMVLPRATDHIGEQISLIQELERKGFTYRITDGIYFDTSKFFAYGALSGQKLEEKEAGARIEVNSEKRHPADFALWKFSPADQKRQMEWPSPWGVGFPGWHIECSAMSAKYLGQPFDVHSGGVDHIPVHHENEIAQSEAAYGKPLANYWLHNEFLLVNGGRMGKSLGNAYTLEDLEKRGFSPMDFRYFCLGAHYRSKLNFTWEGLEGARNALEHISTKIGKGLAYNNSAMYQDGPVSDRYLDDFRLVLEDDLNLPRALAVFQALLQDPTVDPLIKGRTCLRMDEVLGLDLKKECKEWEMYTRSVVEGLIPEDIHQLQQQREEARANKDWKTSDELRDALRERGWVVEDGVEGSVLRKI